MLQLAHNAAMGSAMNQGLVPAEQQPAEGQDVGCKQ